jgi:[FeFe] hydrogenase H-cluster maturation GTPase HydF
MALLIIDATIGIQDFEKEILQQIRSKNIPIVGVLNKTDLIEGLDITHFEKEIDLKLIPISAENKTEIDTLKHAIIKALPDDSTDTLLGDLIEPNDIAVLVVPIDSAAPKGRLILPQQQVVREILDLNGICVVTKEFQLEESLKSLSKKPKVVITDSQAFEMVSKITPEDILLTSFSILFAKYKGDLKELVKGAEYIEKLKDGDHILISEGCTHHRQSDDIGTVKIPKWLKEHTGKDLNFHFSSGYGYPTDLQQFSLIIHCGACMLNKREVLHRIEQAKTNDIPIVNYGVLIAYLKGIFERALIPFDYEFAL